jgi:glycosyltransferase involved in cell wall biosynthesis
MVDKYFFIKGGAERYYFELKTVLERHGHQVIPFSMRHEQNFDSEYAGFFVDQIEFNGLRGLQKLAMLPKITGRILWSTQAQDRIEQLIRQTKPDIAHLHMIDHQISPSILPILRKYGLPILQTVHQYKLVCPNYRMYVEHKEQICEKCLGGKFYHAMLEKCHKDAFFPSFLISVEAYFHHGLGVYDHVALFHAPSAFIGQKLVAGGVQDGRVRHLFYAINVTDYTPHYDHQDYFLYFGRLSAEKGIFTLLKAMKKIDQYTLKIVGDGPLRNDLERFALRNGLSNVEFTGLKSGEELKQIVAKAMFVVVPSEWYENSPLVIYEAFALGKPVVGAAIGGIPELVDHDKNGLLFRAGDAKDLADQIWHLLDHPEKLEPFGMAGRLKAEQQFDAECHYERMMEIYQSLLSSPTGDA